MIPMNAVSLKKIIDILSGSTSVGESAILLNDSGRAGFAMKDGSLYCGTYLQVYPDLDPDAEALGIHAKRAILACGGKYVGWEEFADEDNGFDFVALDPNGWV